MRSCAGYLVSSFDLFNVSDLDLIAQARDLCDQVVVAVLTDEAVETVTGLPPVVPLSGRLALLHHVRGVHRVVVAEPGQERFGAPEDALVMASTVANGLGSSDVTLSSLRSSDSTFLRPMTSAVPMAREAVA